MVRYSGQYPGFYLARTLPFCVLFGIFAALYLDDEYRAFFSRQSASHKPFSWLEFGFLLALVLAPLIDLALTLMRVRRGAIALRVSPEGVTGPVLHIHQLVPWREIADVAVDGKFLVVRRQQRSLFQKLFPTRGLGNMSLPAHHLDRDVDDILAAVHLLAPVAHRRAAAL